VWRKDPYFNNKSEEGKNIEGREWGNFEADEQFST